MSTLRKTSVKKSKKDYKCSDCGRHIPKGSSYTYLYGMAHEGEKPYPLRMCDSCVRDSHPQGCQDQDEMAVHVCPRPGCRRPIIVGNYCMDHGVVEGIPVLEEQRLGFGPIIS